MSNRADRLDRAANDKGLSIGDAWNLLAEAAEYIRAQQRTIQLQANEVRSLEGVEARATISKLDDKCGRVLWHLHNGDVSVGKAAEWMREYILTGKEGSLPPSHRGGE